MGDNAYPIVALDSTFYIFGPVYESRAQKTIAAFDTIKKEWKYMGDLKEDRIHHGVIIHDGDFLVIGGFYWGIESGHDLSIERCILADDSIQCQLIDPVLEARSEFPAMMHVSDDFCIE